MSYRVETASSGRAVCRATECKKAGTKIDKDELRLGSWITYEDRGSWAWKHWGCVTGKQLQNLREYLGDPDRPGVYRWDYLDGYDEEGKSGLVSKPDLQEKVRRVVTQGYIDPEDFNGDPEMNVLGKTGLRTPASKKQMKDNANNLENNLAQLQQNVADAVRERDALQARGESTVDAEAKLTVARAELTKSHEKQELHHVKTENSEETPAKKKRKPKAKKEDSGDENEEKLAKKAKGKKRVKDEDSDEEVLPAKKARAKKVKKEDHVDIIKDEQDSDAPVDLPAPKKRGPKAKKIKEEVDEENNGTAEVGSSEAKLKAPGNKARRKKAVKGEPVEEEAEVNSAAFAIEGTKKTPRPVVKKSVKKEPADQENAEGDVDSAKQKKAPAKRGHGKTAESGDASEEPPAKKARGKKAAKKGTSEDTHMDDATATIEGAGSGESKLTEGSSGLTPPDADEASITVDSPEPVADEEVAMGEVEEPQTKKKAGRAKKAAAPKGQGRRAASRGQTEY